MSDFSDEGIKQAATAAVTQNGDIRTRMHDLTLAALRKRRLEASEMKSIMQALTQGISLGLDKRTQDSKEALAQAIAGLDAALLKSAEAAHLALRQLSDRGRDFSKQELATVLDNLKKMEGDFLSTLHETANKSSGRVKAELEELLTHTRRTGTDSGRQVQATLAAFSQQIQGVVHDTHAAGSHATHELSARFLQIASGILDGIAESLDDQ